MRNLIYILLVILTISCNNTNYVPIEYFDDDLSNENLNEEIINTASFTELTKWPNNIINTYPNPNDIIEWGKEPILGIKKLHEEGITGKNINVAIIDGPFNSNHQEFSNKTIEIINIGNFNLPALHGTIVTSILSGKNVGIAPDINLFYFAESTNIISGYKNKIMALRKIFEYNQENDNKIQIVSISIGKVKELNYFEEYLSEIKKLEKTGVMVFHLAMKPRIFAGLEYELLSDRSDYQNLKNNSLTSGLIGKLRMFLFYRKSILLPWADYTVAHSENNSSYMFIGKSSWGFSWTVPIVSGMAALALQVNGELTKDEILANILESGIKHNGSVIPNMDEFISLCKNK